MNLRIRLAIFSSLITLLALFGLSVVTGLGLKASLIRDLDEELKIQATQILDEALADNQAVISSDVENTLVTDSGTTTAFLYFKDALQAGAGTRDAPNEPLNPGFFRAGQNTNYCNCYDWRVVSLRSGNFAVQVGRPLSVINRNTDNYIKIILIVSLIASVLSGIVASLVVNKTLDPLEHLATRVQNLESGAPIPGIELPDEIGVLARALYQSLQELQLSRAQQNRFVVDAAHELRTPVTALLVDLEANRMRSRSESENQAVLERSWRTAKHLRQLTNNLLTLSQTERQLQFQDMDLLEVASNITDRLMPLAASKDLELSIDGEVALLRADRLMIERVLENILGNALKFTTSGEVRVLVQIQDFMVQLEVKDTGIGMSQSDLEFVFEAFHRGNTKLEGSGLGLAVVKAVMDAHQGTVKINSQPNVGTKVLLEFPIR